MVGVGVGGGYICTQPALGQVGLRPGLMENSGKVSWMDSFYMDYRGMERAPSLSTVVDFTGFGLAANVNTSVQVLIEHFSTNSCQVVFPFFYVSKNIL